MGKWRVPSNDANISLYLPRRPPCILLSRPPHTHLDAQIERSRGQMKNANETPVDLFDLFFFEHFQIGDKFFLLYFRRTKASF